MRSGIPRPDRRLTVILEYRANPCAGGRRPRALPLARVSPAVLGVGAVQGVGVAAAEDLADGNDGLNGRDF